MALFRASFIMTMIVSRNMAAGAAEAIMLAVEFSIQPEPGLSKPKAHMVAMVMMGNHLMDQDHETRNRSEHQVCELPEHTD